LFFFFDFLERYGTILNMLHDIFVCSAFQDIPDNQVSARIYCRYVMDNDEDANVTAPHIFYTQFLDNKNKAEWERGFRLGVARLLKSTHMYVFVRNGVLTDGMVYEIKQAINAGPQQYYFDATDRDNITPMPHIPSGAIPTQSQLLAPKPFASKASKGLDSIAAALKAGKRYEDLQDELEAFMGPVDASEERDLDAEEAWENNYRVGR
jgi:hypothetical protein